MPKGVYVRTEDAKRHMRKPKTKAHCEHIRQGKLGTVFSKKWKENIRLSISGSKNPNYGHPRDAATRLKIKIANSGPKPYLRGKNNPNWRGGIYPLVKRLRNCPVYKAWRTAVFKRDNYTCRRCNKRGVILNAHHHKKRWSILVKEAIKQNPCMNPYDACICYAPLWRLSNGITLCEICHNKTKGDCHER